MRTEGHEGNGLMLKVETLGLEVDIQVFKFNTIIDSITMYHFPRTLPSENSVSQISLSREPDAEMVKAHSTSYTTRTSTTPVTTTRSRVQEQMVYNIDLEYRYRRSIMYMWCGQGDSERGHC